MQKINKEEIRKIFIETFADSKIPGDIANLKLGEIEEWDSLGNFNLLLAIEEYYKVKFDMDQMSSIKSVKDIINNLEKIFNK